MSDREREAEAVRAALDDLLDEIRSPSKRTARVLRAGLAALEALTSALAEAERERDLLREGLLRQLHPAGVDDAGSRREGDTMSTQIICRRCMKPITVTDDVHRVRIVLVSAHESAPRKHVDKEDDFHHQCAAEVFRAFDTEASRG